MLPWLSKGTLRRQTCAFYIVFLMFSDVAPKWAQDAIRRRPWTPARSTKGRPESLSRMPCRQNLQVTKSDSTCFKRVDPIVRKSYDVSSICFIFRIRDPSETQAGSNLFHLTRTPDPTNPRHGK